LTRHILPKSPLAPLCQRGEFLPLAKGGEEGFSFKRLYNYGMINNSQWLRFDSVYMTRKAAAKKGLVNNLTTNPQFRSVPQLPDPARSHLFRIILRFGFYLSILDHQELGEDRMPCSSQSQHSRLRKNQSQSSDHHRT